MSAYRDPVVVGGVEWDDPVVVGPANVIGGILEYSPRKRSVDRWLIEMRPVLKDIESALARRHPHVTFSLSEQDFSIGIVATCAGVSERSSFFVVSETDFGEAIRHHADDLVRIIDSRIGAG